MNQEIPDSGGDIIENVEPSSWQKGECVPMWVEVRVHTEQFTEQYT